jgi:hypothetical protein
VASSYKSNFAVIRISINRCTERNTPEDHIVIDFAMAYERSFSNSELVYLTAMSLGTDWYFNTYSEATKITGDENMQTMCVGSHTLATLLPEG